MKNHTDDAKSAGTAPDGNSRQTLKQEKLARALRSNLARRKQAGVQKVPSSLEKNG